MSVAPACATICAKAPDAVGYHREIRPPSDIAGSLRQRDVLGIFQLSGGFQVAGGGLELTSSFDRCLGGGDLQLIGCVLQLVPIGRILVLAHVTLHVGHCVTSLLLDLRRAIPSPLSIDPRRPSCAGCSRDRVQQFRVQLRLYQTLIRASRDCLRPLGLTDTPAQGDDAGLGHGYAQPADQIERLGLWRAQLDQHDLRMHCRRYVRHLNRRGG